MGLFRLAARQKLQKEAFIRNGWKIIMDNYKNPRYSSSINLCDIMVIIKTRNLSVFKNVLIKVYEPKEASVLNNKFFFLDNNYCPTEQDSMTEFPQDQGQFGLVGGPRNPLDDFYEAGGIGTNNNNSAPAPAPI